MATLVSAFTPWCTAAQFVQLTDWRMAAQYLSDNNQQPPKGDLLDPTTIVGANLLVALQTASGQFEGKVLKGHRYDIADLQTLVAPNTLGQVSNAGVRIASIVANLATWLVIGRRWVADRPKPVSIEATLLELEMLAKGEDIFGLQETQDAGVIQDTVETRVQVEKRNLTTFQAKRLFGDRSDRWQ